MVRASTDSHWTWMAVALAWLLIVLVLLFHVTIVLVSAMVVYGVGLRLTEWLRRRTRLRQPAAWGIAIAIMLIIGLAIALAERVTDAAASGSGYQALVAQTATTLDQLRGTLPDWLASHLPASLDDLRATAATWLRDHAGQVRLWGQHTLRVTAQLLGGTIIGALAVIETQSFHTRELPLTPWESALRLRFALFAQSFDAVVFAQVRIALINALLTAVYLLGVIPILGARLPLAGTMVAFTFVASLIPVVGNLISNAVIVVISITQGLWIAGTSLAFLVLIHKLEYFLNARIIGGSIGTRAFELLAVMLLSEAIFGLAGLVMAPIIYAYAKAEMRSAKWL